MKICEKFATLVFIIAFKVKRGGCIFRVCSHAAFVQKCYLYQEVFIS